MTPNAILLCSQISAPFSHQQRGCFLQKQRTNEETNSQTLHRKRETLAHTALNEMSPSNLSTTGTGHLGQTDSVERNQMHIIKHALEAAVFVHQIMQSLRSPHLLRRTNDAGKITCTDAQTQEACFNVPVQARTPSRRIIASLRAACATWHVLAKITQWFLPENKNNITKQNRAYL